MSQPLPRKFLSQLRQAQEELQTLARRARTTLEQLQSARRPPDEIEANLRDMESSAYRIALELTDLKLADDCRNCPSAPASTPARLHLLVLANELEQQAQLARMHACECGDHEEQAALFQHHLLPMFDVATAEALSHRQERNGVQ